MYQMAGMKNKKICYRNKVCVPGASKQRPILNT